MIWQDNEYEDAVIMVAHRPYNEFRKDTQWVTCGVSIGNILENIDRV